MSTIFALFFFILLIVLVIGLLLLSAVVRFFTGLGRKATGYKQHEDAGRNTSDFTYRNSTSPGTKKKVFDDDEGEYVDFEEVKDCDLER